MPYFYLHGTMEVTWDPSEFIQASHWLEQQGLAAEAEVEAKGPGKGHAAHHPQAQTQQPQTGHAADQ